MMIILIAIALAASLVDVTLTLRLLLCGYGDEINPLMRWAVRIGPFTAYSLAAIQTIVAGAIGCILIGSGAAAYGWALLGLLVTVRVGSFIWNARIYRGIA
jgi:hypothetical protein